MTQNCTKNQFSPPPPAGFVFPLLVVIVTVAVGSCKKSITAQSRDYGTVQINPKSRMNTTKGRVEHNLSYAKWISFEYIEGSRWPFKIHKIMLDLTASSGCRPRYLTCENRPWFFLRSFSRIFIEIFDIFSMGNREMFINSNNCFLILSLVADVIKEAIFQIDWNNTITIVRWVNNLSTNITCI